MLSPDEAPIFLFFNFLAVEIRFVMKQIFHWICVLNYSKWCERACFVYSTGSCLIRMSGPSTELPGRILWHNFLFSSSDGNFFQNPDIFVFVTFEFPFLILVSPLKGVE